MRELGLSYEKPEKKRLERLPPFNFQKEIEKKRLLERKRLNYLEKTGIAEILVEKGEIKILDNWHIGQVRGAEIAKKIIKPTLKEMKIEFQIEYDERKTRVILTEEGKQKLREEIEKLN